METSQETLLHAIALSQIDGIGPILARKLIQQCGSPSAVFREKKEALLAIEGLGRERIKAINSSFSLHRAEAELKVLEKRAWIAHYIKDPAYPRRLRNANDAPIVIFQKGEADLNVSRALAIVGSRKMTDEGRAFIESFCGDLTSYGVLTISGLAYGVDGTVHRSSLKNGINNVAVVAHGLDRVYPFLHKKLAQDVVEAGGAIVSEFLSGTEPERENFPKRNRIIAGLSDAVLVVEAARKGGALITAQYANDYNRDVFAVPGMPGQESKAGCNLLIKSHRANLLESVKDLEYVLRWEQGKGPKAATRQMHLSAQDQDLVDLLGQNNTVKDFDWLCHASKLGPSEVLSRLVALELEGLVKPLSGSRYRLLIWKPPLF